MNTPFSRDLYSDLLESLNAAIAERAAAERRLAELQSEERPGELDTEEVHDHLGWLAAQEQAAQAAVEEAYSQTVAEVENRYQAETAAAESTARRERSQVGEHFERETKAIESQYDENRWIMTSLVDESAEDNPKRQLETFKTQIERLQERLSDDWEELNELSGKAVETVKDRRHYREEPVALEHGPGPNREEAQKRFDEAVREARAEYERLNSQILSRLLSGTGIIWVGLLLWLVPFGVLAGLAQPDWIGLKNFSPKAWALVSAGVTFALSSISLMVMWFVASRKTWEAFEPFRIHVSDAYQNYKQWRKFAKAELRAWKKPASNGTKP